MYCPTSFVGIILILNHLGVDAYHVSNLICVIITQNLVASELRIIFAYN
jgi:hypothetical protein